ncbi:MULTISPECIES: saccharopine dehydrogenase NADP-binding domain-containing protein [Streptomyces]|uniref:saccharopine dehydrogenase NADP-binding domain-containing protein n=1 Tax=Streptomyces TaxID=1883 RepID=UPI00055CBBFF|nr:MULTISPECIES: saccharopine dehydrogenase NADP-binding domain-containing protein [Streptomyces]MBZ6109497.1 saccharopine dehydrogenase NADP-binding domain-containing protein [Streptomyces olivaceus]MBZ6123576.1 saccharopine dehydrogenase NADP-binding domain-containing protein [Streptomyces olivaceus]MBZ6143684.1 saccharopine dehydrogenase NADP-binding domain-containing protein [Streptomyces olivaceus]MBZ6157524.1 saccharopine dehydrogenase NADP-binding domain-containing protein [Streptomyces 
MSTPVIGVLGASGAVGRAAVRELRALGRTGLRLGGRTASALCAVAGEDPGGHDESVWADATAPDGLRAFTEGCDIVLNCVGPTYRLRATVAAAALAAGAHCVDVAGDDPAAEDLLKDGDPAREGRTVVLSAGALPGLSSLLPRWLAGQGLDTATALSAHCGGLETCSPTVARDLMLSLTSGGADGAAYGEALAAVRGGRRVPRALRTAEDAEHPSFPGRVALQPYLSGESERLADVLGLDRLDWYNVHPGPAVRALLNRLPASLAAGDDPAALADRLILAADLDLAGRTPYYVMDFALSGTASGQPATAGLTLRAASSYRLTAAVGALSVDAVLRGAVPAGVHFACDVLDPRVVVRHLRSRGAAELRLTGTATAGSGPAGADADADVDMDVEEGVL